MMLVISLVILQKVKGVDFMLQNDGKIISEDHPKVFIKNLLSYAVSSNAARYM